MGIHESNATEMAEIRKTHRNHLFDPLSDDDDWKHFCVFFFVENLDLMSSDRRAIMKNEEATIRLL